VPERERYHAKGGSDGMWIVKTYPKPLRRERLHVTGGVTPDDAA
jgi:hypothetical protein